MSYSLYAINFYIPINSLQLLLDAGSAIPEKKYKSGGKDEAVDILRQSVSFLEVHRGLASDAYIALGNVDPIDKSFNLAARLEELSTVRRVIIISIQ